VLLHPGYFWLLSNVENALSYISKLLCGRRELDNLLLTVAHASAYSATCWTERAAVSATATRDKLDIERSVVSMERDVLSNPVPSDQGAG
jgi:hypothetical protein